MDKFDENIINSKSDTKRYDRRGFDETGMHKDTGTRYDSEGYDSEGYDERDFNRKGVHKHTHCRYDFTGYNKQGFNRRRIHKETGTRYDPEGYDSEGYNSEWVDRDGFNIQGIHKDTRKKYSPEGYDKYGYNKYGYNKEGYDRRGFDETGIHKETGTKYNLKGYDKEGCDKEGYDKKGYNKEGYNKRGFNRKGFSIEGIHKYTETRYDSHGYDKDGYDEDGFNIRGKHKETGTKYNPEGYDKYGYNKEGYNRRGKNREGFNSQGYNLKGYDKEGYDSEGYDRYGFNKYEINKQGIDKATGKKSVLIIAVKQYLDSKQSIGLFCRKNNINKQQFQQLLKDIPDMYPEITRERLMEVSNRSSEVYLHKRENVLNQLVSGKKTFEEYLEQDSKSVNYDQLIAVASQQGKLDFINSLLITAMTSGKMKYKSYMNLFTDKDDNTDFHKAISLHVEEVLKIARNNPQLRQACSGLYKEKQRLVKFKNQVKDSELIGSRRSFDFGKTFVEVTEEHVEQAKQYVRSSGEFVCAATVNDALTKLLKGEINPNEIRMEQEDKAYEKTELRKLIEQKQSLIDEKVKLPHNLAHKYSSIYSQAKEKEEVVVEDGTVI